MFSLSDTAIYSSKIDCRDVQPRDEQRTNQSGVNYNKQQSEIKLNGHHS